MHRRLLWTFGLLAFLALAIGAAHAATTYYYDDDGSPENAMQFDYADDGAVKYIWLPSGSLSGATSAQASIDGKADAGSCTEVAAYPMFELRVNGGYVQAFNPCLVWPDFMHTRYNADIPVSLLRENQLNSIELRDAGHWTTQNAWLGIDSTNDRGRSYIHQCQSGNCPPGDNIPGELMWSILVVTGGGGGGNNGPYDPAAPSGPGSATAGTAATYSAWTTDPENDLVNYEFDWGDGQSYWTGYLSSGTTGYASHTWASSGTFQVRVRAHDDKGVPSGWSTPTAVLVAPANRAPYTPTLVSPAFWQAGVSPTPTFTWSATAPGDPDGDAVTYSAYTKRDWESTYTLRCTTAYPSTSCTSGTAHALGTAYHWYVSASDGRGGTADSSMGAFVTRTNSPPRLCVAVTRDGLAVTVTNTCNDPDGDPVDYTFEWGDGTTSQILGSTSATNARSHTYGDAYCPSGTAYVTLRATDGYASSSDGPRSVFLNDDYDQDMDALVGCLEARQGTSDTDRDTDDDGIEDYNEFRDARLPNINPTLRQVFCASESAPDSQCSFPHPAERDLYVELDWQTGMRPSDAVLSSVAGAFAAAGIHLAVDTGWFGNSQSDLGAPTPVSWNQVEMYQGTHMNGVRQGVFHYAASACRSVEPGLAGYAEAPGDRFALYVGNDACTGLQGDGFVTAVFLHELGHNVLGLRLAPSGGDRNAGACPQVHTLHNDALAADFDHPRDAVDCDGHGGLDYFLHSSDAADAMYGGGLSTQSGFLPSTQNALRLHMSVGPTARTCRSTGIIPPPEPTGGYTTSPVVEGIIGMVTGLLPGCGTATVHADRTPARADADPAHALCPAQDVALRGTCGGAAALRCRLAAFVAGLAARGPEGILQRLAEGGCALEAPPGRLVQGAPQHGPQPGRDAGGCGGRAPHDGLPDLEVQQRGRHRVAACQQLIEDHRR